MHHKKEFEQHPEMQYTNRLQLDIPHKDDFERFFEIHSNPQNNIFNPAGPMNLDSAKKVFGENLKHWQEHGFGSWIVKTIMLNTIIGFGGLSYRLYGTELKLNLGYRFDKAFWGQGFATELAKHAINHGFNNLEKTQIFAIVRPQHAASVNVLEKCNMKMIGTLGDVPNEADSLIYCIEKNAGAVDPAIY